MSKRLGKSNEDDAKEIQEKLQLAKDIVSNEEEPFKTEAFKILFSKFLESSFHMQKDTATEDVTKDEPTSLDAKIVKFAKNCSISKEELEDVFSIHEDSIKIIVPINGNESFKRLIASLCYLMSAEIILGKEWIESKELAEVMREIGVKDLANLAPQLKKNNDLIRIDAKQGNNKYKLTSGAGRQKALEIIRKLAKGELIEN